MLMHRDVGPDPWICGKPAWHNHPRRSEFLPVRSPPPFDLPFPFFPCEERIDARLAFLSFVSILQSPAFSEIFTVLHPGERLKGTKSSLLLAAMPIATPAEKPVIPGPVRASPSRYRPSGGRPVGQAPPPDQTVTHHSTPLRVLKALLRKPLSGRTPKLELSLIESQNSKPDRAYAGMTPVKPFCYRSNVDRKPP